MYWVYIHTNKVTGKKYVGQTTQKPRYRWGRLGRGYAGQPKFFNAILKYGWDNFSHQVIEVDSPEEADYLERYLIAFYDTIRNGYNLSPGGKDNKSMSEESRKKISEALRGKPKSEEAKKKFSELRKGKPKSEEHKRRISETLKGRPSPKKGRAQEKALYQNSETGQIREMSIQQHKNPRWIRIN